MQLIVINKLPDVIEEAPVKPKKKKMKKKYKPTRGKQGGQLPGFEKGSMYITGGQTMKKLSSSIETNRGKH